METDEFGGRGHKRGGVPLQFFAAFAASISEVVIGFVYGWASPTLPRLQDPSWPWQLSSEEASWVVSLVDIGSLIAPIPAGLAANRWGRRKVLLFSAVPFLLSWALIAEARSVWWLYAARMLAGLGGGTVFTVNTLYWGEISSAGFRGSASSLTQATLFLGVLLADGIGASVSYASFALWGAGITVLFAVCFGPMPESPYFLLMKDRPDMAKQALKRLRGREDVSEELRSLEAAVRSDMALGSDAQCGCSSLVGTPGTIRALVIATVLGALQRLSGLSAIIAYTSGTLPKSLKEIGPLLVSSVLFVASFGPLYLMDRLGRRPLLLGSSIVVTISMFGSGIYYHLANNHHDVDGLNWLPLSCLMLFAVAYALGMGPVPDAIPGEVFPTNVKGLAVSAVNVSLTLFTFLVSKMYQVVEDSLGVQYMFWGFSIVGIVTAVFSCTVMPETRGKTLEQVRAELERGKENSSSAVRSELQEV